MKNRPALPTLALVLALAACRSTDSPQAPAAQASRSLTEEEAVETFDRAWSLIHETHFDQDFNGTDWVALREELLPRVREAEDEADLRGLVGEMLGRLGQSHFSLIPREARPAYQGNEGIDQLAGGFGFDLRYREDALLVSQVDEGGPAHAAGVRPGWMLIEAAGDDLESWRGAHRTELDPRRLANMVRRRALMDLYGEVGTPDRLVFQDGEDRRVELDLERAERDVIAHSFGDLPTFYLRFDSRSVEHGEHSFGLIHFTNWFLPMVKPIDEAIDRLRDKDGIVLDLRGNSGGAGAMTMGTAGHFFEERRELGRQTLRAGEMKFVAMPRLVNASGERVRPFAGPVAILVDETTGSASEVFAGGMQSVGRVRVFGETSAGAVLPARTTELPNGDSLLHAMGDFETADGTHLEGRGVVPDELVPLTRDGLLAGDDVQLRKALEWMATSQP